MITSNKFSCTAGTLFLLQENFKAVASDEFNFTLQIEGDKLNLVLDDSKFSLTNGTQLNLTWEDGTKFQMNSTGSIVFGDAGIKITSDDENLDMTFSSPAMSTDISGIKDAIYYNAGTVSFDENSKITATTTLGGTGHIDFNTSNGVIYAADTGALKVTWSRGELESTFIVKSGSVQIGHNLFRITEGSDIATDLKNFVPAFYFTTSEAGTYTISDDSQISTKLRAHFDNGLAYSDKVNNLNGTVSGNFSDGRFSINGSAGMQILEDTDVSISANRRGFEIF